MEEHVMRWKAYEYHHHKKDADWYWFFGTIVLALIGFAIYVQNILFAFVVGIGAFTMTLYASMEPKMVEYSVDEEGVHTDMKSHDFRSLESFWIVRPKKEGEEKVLLLQSAKRTEPLIIIPLGEVSLDELREYLLLFLDEKRMPLPLGVIIMDMLGF